MFGPGWSDLPHKLNAAEKRSLIHPALFLKSRTAEIKTPATTWEQKSRPCLSLPFTHQTDKKIYKWTVPATGMRKRSALSHRRAVSASSHLWAVTPWLWYPIVTAMNFPHCYRPTTLLSQGWMNGTHGNRCNSLLLARYLAESHNVPVIEVELLKKARHKKLEI